jgi:SAM-dependent methyltransferase
MNTDKYYQTRFVEDKSREKVWRAINEYLQKYVKENATVLDLGCGYGDFVKGIKAESKFAIDLNDNLKIFFEKEKIKFISQSVLTEFAIPDNSVDVVFASNLFEHFSDDELEKMMNNIDKILKPNGRIILLQPNIYYAYKEYWDDYTHKKAFSHVSLADFLMAHDFHIIKFYKKFIPFSLKSRLPKSYWLTRLYLNFPIKPFAKQMLVVAEKK